MWESLGSGFKNTLFQMSIAFPTICRLLMIKKSHTEIYIFIIVPMSEHGLVV